MNKKTREDRLLELLSDRMWHTSAEAQKAAGHRFSTVVLDLRKKGYEINGEQVTARSWRWQLVKTPDENTVPVRRGDGQALLGFEGAGE